MFTLFDKEGNECVALFTVDKKEMLDSGNYFESKPEIKEQELVQTKQRKNSKKEEADKA